MNKREKQIALLIGVVAFACMVQSIVAPCQQRGQVTSMPPAPSPVAEALCASHNGVKSTLNERVHVERGDVIPPARTRLVSATCRDGIIKVVL